MGRMRWFVTAAALGAACVVQAQVCFYFTEGSGLHKTGCGGSAVLDESGGVTLKTVDVIGQDGSRASAGNKHETYVNAKSGTLGINSTKKGSIGGYSQEFLNFNPGEAWIIAFDADVTLQSIDLEGQGTGAEMTVSSDAFKDLVLGDTAAAAGFHTLEDVKVPAGAEVMFKMTGAADAADTSVRIKSLTVEVKK